MSIVIVGAGPNLGLAVGRRFGREGLAVGLVSRTQAKLDDLAAQLESEGITAAGAAADIRDSDALAAAIASLAQRLGAVEVLEYSPLPAPEFMKPILETTVEDVRGPLEFSVLGAVAAARAVLGPMREAGRGTILYTTGGAAIHPYPLRAGVGISFAGEVAYARMLHDELADEDIHVAHTAIAGRMAAGRRPRAGRCRRGPVVAPRRPRALPDADRLRRRARLGAIPGQDASSEIVSVAACPEAAPESAWDGSGRACPRAQ
jgi:NADP-dependent 3-hydroxy acid dehydrogenase YdfG